MKRILFTNTKITDLLGHFPNSTVPLISCGTLAKSATELPAIVFYMETGIPSRTQELRYMKIDCYGEDYDSSNLLAETVLEELNGKDHDIGVMLHCSILEAQLNPDTKEVNTPIECRLIKIGGA